MINISGSLLQWLWISRLWDWFIIVNIIHHLTTEFDWLVIINLSRLLFLFVKWDHVISLVFIRCYLFLLVKILALKYLSFFYSSISFYYSYRIYMYFTIKLYLLYSDYYFFLLKTNNISVFLYYKYVDVITWHNLFCVLFL